jgi:hypothetical protein
MACTLFQAAHLFLVQFCIRTPTPILDKLRRIITVLAGWPHHDSWNDVNQKVCKAIEHVHSICNFPKKAKAHHRGNFPAMAIGISHGGGQKVHHHASNPGTLTPCPLETWEPLPQQDKWRRLTELDF